MAKREVGPRQPMDLSLNSNANIREGVTGDMILEESRQQVQYRSEPEYEMMIAAYNALQNSKAPEDKDAERPIPAGFKAMQRVFRESNQNFEYSKITRDIVDAIDMADMEKHADKIKNYAVRVGYAGGGNEIPMSELIDNEAKKQMRSVMGSTTDVDSIVEHMQDAEEAESNGEAKNVSNKIDAIEKKSRPNLKLNSNQETQEIDMTKMTRTAKRRVNNNPRVSAAAEKTPQARNKTSKEEMKARRVNDFSNLFQSIVNDIAAVAADVEEIRLKVVELTRLSIDNGTAEAACSMTIMVNDMQKPVDMAYDVLVPDEDDIEIDDQSYDPEDDELLSD